MKALEEKIVKEGTVLPGNVLKVGSFLNQQMDSDFIMEIGKEIARLYEGTGVTRILTIESSGIALAVAAGIAMHVPTVFAKKHRSANMPKSVYTAPVYSFTHHETYEIAVAREYLPAGEKVLIVDDFLANGNAVRGLMHIRHRHRKGIPGSRRPAEKRGRPHRFPCHHRRHDRRERHLPRAVKQRGFFFPRYQFLMHYDAKGE